MASKMRKSRILEEMHETAKGLHEVGLIDERRMREYDALCHIDIVPFSPAQIRSLREKFELSQAVLAALLNTSVATVQQWEIGDKKPSGSSLKLLNLIERKGLEAVI
jgi:putative transcriptional regulator